MQGEYRNGLSFNPQSSEAQTSQIIDILVVEDDVDLLALLELSVKRLGYNPLSATDGQQALEIFSTESVDLILLDVMLPKMSGPEVCEEIRRHSDVPIIVLTALDTSEHVEHMLSLGADEYITKPFRFEVLATRIQALLRRISWTNETPLFSQITVGDITLDADRAMVTVHDRQIMLTDTETNLLHKLMHRAGKPVSANDLYQDVWGSTGKVSSTALETAIRRLRLKLEEDPSKPNYIITVKGHGYKFQTDLSDQLEMVLQPETKQPTGKESTLSAGNLQLDLNGRALSLNGQTIMLSEIDFRLIGYLMEHADQVIDRQTLLKCGWAHNPNAKPAFVAAAIQRLRSKIEDNPARPRYLITVPKRGYRLCT